MARRWVWLLAVPIAIVALLAFKGTNSAGADQDHTEGGAQVEAMAALGIKDGDCTAVADALYRRIEPTEIDAQAARMNGSGWVKWVYVGTPEDLAAANKANLVASSDASSWLLLIDSSGAKSLREYRRVDLPSGKVAWQPGSVIEPVPCE